MSGSGRKRPRRRYSFSKAPKRVYLEITRACPLACSSCPIGTTPNRHPRELTTEEAKALIKEIHSFSTPPPDLIITGGDPLCREDLEDIVASTAEFGIEVVLWLGPTRHLTKERLQALKTSGAGKIALSLDDVSAEGHDRRHSPGSYDRTLQGLADARAIGLDIHVNTLICNESLVDVPKVFEKVRSLNVDQWNLFFLVPTSEKSDHQEINPLQAEVLMNWVYDVSRTAPFPIEVMEAPQYRRIVFQRLRDQGVPLTDIAKAPQADRFGLRDGNGIVFISHVGDVYPSPFLPIVAGNVRGRSLTSLYRRSQIFRDLRDPSRLKGDCSRCQYRRICGGSRARAFAASKDWTGTDPLCAYQPVGIKQAY